MCKGRTSVSLYEYVREKEMDKHKSETEIGLLIIDENRIHT